MFSFHTFHSFPSIAYIHIFHTHELCISSIGVPFVKPYVVRGGFGVGVVVMAVNSGVARVAIRKARCSRSSRGNVPVH